MRGSLRLGIPAAAIVDIDILAQGGSNWTNHLSACGIPVTQHQPKGTERANAWIALQAKAPNPASYGGLNLLDGSDREAAEDLLDFLDKCGLFTVRRGELENWLETLKVAREKRKWLRQIFEALGDDPASEHYVRPSKGDVWDFIADIKKWLIDPQRKGIPA
ncbi:MAG: hypothetical protein ACLPPF_03870 [Rhodomicrobium sp.]